MCGICGIINFNREKINREKISSMVKMMKHRGPDDDGIYQNNNFALGSTRLSILDLSNLSLIHI